MKEPAIPCHKIYEKADTGLFIRRISMNDSEGRHIPYHHRDDYFLFIKVERGSLRASVDFRHTNLKAGEGAVIMPGQVHRIETGTQDLEVWILAITPELLPMKYSDAFVESTLHPHPILFENHDNADLACLLSMLHRRRGDEKTMRPLALAAISIFLTALQTGDDQRGDRYLSIMLRFCNLLDKKIRVEKRPSAYASELNISEVYLNEAVKSMTGKNVSGFIRSQVVLIAKRELIYSDLSPVEISERLGYVDYAYFSRLFRKDAGISPREFRKNHK